MSDVIDTKLDAEAEMDELISMLCLRNEDLMSEKQAALQENDALRSENVDLCKELAEAQKQLAMMRGA